MAGIMTQEMVHRSHLPESERQQGYMNNVSPTRSSGPRDVPSTLSYKDVPSAVPLSHESPSRTNTNSQTEPKTAWMELPAQPHSQPQSERGGTGRTSKTSINHLLSPEQPVHRHVPPQPPQQQQRRVECPDCHESILTSSENGPSIAELTEHKAQCSSRKQPARSNGKTGQSPSGTLSGSDEESEVEVITPFQRKKVQANEAERYAIFAKDAQIAQIEEYRVLCAICRTWVQLRKDRPYCPLSWTAHKLECRRRKPTTKPATQTKKQRREHTAASVTPNTSHAHYPPPPSTTSNHSHSNASTPALTASHITTPVQIRRTEEQRIFLLQTDPDAKEIEPHRVLCAICDRWIQLRKNSTYCTAPWVQHVKKCAAKHGRPVGSGASSNGAGPSSYVGSMASMVMDVDGEDELDSNMDEDMVDIKPVIHAPSPASALQASAQALTSAQPEQPVKRKPGRPRKRKIGQLKGPFSTAPLEGRDSRAVSPPRLRTPTPPLTHPLQDNEYLYSNSPPTITWQSLYAGSQYDENEDKYKLYFHAPRPGDPAMSETPPLPGATMSTTTGKGPDGTNKKWIVWVLKNYENNMCPFGGSPGGAENGQDGRRNGQQENLPLYRSMTWSHLMDPNAEGGLHGGPGPALGNVSRSHSPYAPTMGPPQHTPPPMPQLSLPTLPPPPPPMHPQQFDERAYLERQPPPPPIPPPTYRRSPPPHTHTPVRKEMPWDRPAPYADDRTLALPAPSHSPRYRPYPQPGLSSHSKHSLPPPPPPPPRWGDGYGPDRYPYDRGPVPPEPPRGSDLEAEDNRLSYTLKCIGYLFKTQFQGANDMSLDTLMDYMNAPFGKEEFGEHELRTLVGVLGARKLLEFTPEGGLQLLDP
ncbi:hypothetical protein M422DRAFT_34948 [Sphaerobolus stellatus SS14]|uniref:Uncharacterized protein n=1 Tax=Sphaerobolus stellatus (strain SS14) TaxID=990650 RepID=A0A0C9UJ30_SPHS4|nr:hypothetical protein M422DRAFT_34948 [Sphaerobolus stellatus SS14]